jgi:2-polyprenyl-6-hydroxyphenyl methylase/3-demethylubiquinone-9 3-methyltransferase
VGRLIPRSLARRARRGIVGLLVDDRYEPGTWTPEDWRRTYVAGSWDYLAGLDELPRYGIILGYLAFLGGDPEILDVGCGEGLLRERLQGVRFRRYVGVDPVRTIIEKARRLEDERTTFVAGDPVDRSLDLGTFDVVVCNEVLSIVPDPAATVARAHELLRPGGHLITSIWHHADDEALWDMIDRHFDPVDRVEVANPASSVALRGWRVMYHRRRE